MSSSEPDCCHELQPKGKKRKVKHYNNWLRNPEASLPRQTKFNMVMKANANVGAGTSKFEVEDGSYGCVDNDSRDIDIGNEDIFSDYTDCDGDLEIEADPECDNMNTGTADDELDNDMPDINDLEYHARENEEEELYDEDDITQDDEIDNEDDPKIYNGARITVATSMLLILTYIVRHCLSGVALIDLLALIELHCLADNLCKSTLHKFHSYFTNLKTPCEQHYYCSKCSTYFGAVETGICDKCKKDTAYFFVNPLSSTLQEFFSRDRFWELVRYPISRTKLNDDHIEDVYDGRLYKEHFDGLGFFNGTTDAAKQKEIHISFQLNTDGVAIFKSCKSSVWPVFMTINELHPKLRFSREYRILCGMWFGPTKPDFNIFMQPFANMLIDLYTKGTTVTLNDGTTKTVKGILISAVFDSPARCLFQNFIQFNGKHGCAYCLSPGKQVKTSETGSTRTYPYDSSSSTGHGQTRTHSETTAFAKSAKVGAPVMGVKGWATILNIPKFDIIRGVAPDYMHGVCIGIMKMLVSLWFDISHRREVFSIRKFVKNVDSRLELIRPPNIISRTPQLIESHIKWWKASEYRAFLLYYSVPCLYGILPNEYFEHYLLFVNALHILLSSSISNKDIERARTMFKLFSLRINSLYKPRYNTWNMHSIMHYCNSVEDLGPLYTFSCFWYEDFNGDLRNMFHGTHGIERQILTSFSISQQIPKLALKLCPDTLEFELYNHMRNKSRTKKPIYTDLIGGSAYVVGAITLTTNSSYLFQIQSFVGEVSRVYSFKRMSLAGVIVQSKAYDLVKKRNSFTVAFQIGDQTQHGHVQVYFKCYRQCKNSVFCNEHCECKDPVYVAVIRELSVNSNFQYSGKEHVNELTKSHIIPVVKPRSLSTQQDIVVPVSSITGLCVWMDVGTNETAYLGLLPNVHEKD